MSKHNLIDLLFTSLARGEEQLYPDAKVLPDFTRSIQLNSYSCGCRSTFIILRYFNKRCIYQSVQKQLKANKDGTSPSDIIRVFRQYGLRVTTKAKMTIRELKDAIDNDSPLLISICSDKHYAVVYGYSLTHIFVMNSSLDAFGKGVGSIKCSVLRPEFLGTWDCWGLVVSL